jgi:hypothetical protein
MLLNINFLNLLWYTLLARGLCGWNPLHAYAWASCTTCICMGKLHYMHMHGQVALHEYAWASCTRGVFANTFIPFRIFLVLFKNVQIKVCITAMLPAFYFAVGLPFLAVRQGRGLNTVDKYVPMQNIWNSKRKKVKTAQ